MLQSLGINESFFYILAIFLLTYAILYPLVLKPVSAYVEERDHRMEGREEEALELREEALKVQQQLSEETKAAQIEASKAFNNLKARALEDQRNILTQAREKSAAEIKVARDNVGAQLSTEVKKIESEIPKLARMVLDQILGTANRNVNKTTSLETEV